jgi:hypothetical protein
VERILKSYPSVKEWQIELASLYARAVPPRGRLKRVARPNNVKVTVTKKRLRNSSIRG